MTKIAFVPIPKEVVVNASQRWGPISLGLTCAKRYLPMWPETTLLTADPNP